MFLAMVRACGAGLDVDRQVEPQGNGSGKGAALRQVHLLGNRGLEPVAVATGHRLRLRFDFVDEDADAAALPLPVAGKCTPLALQELVECAHVGPDLMLRARRATQESLMLWRPPA